LGGYKGRAKQERTYLERQYKGRQTIVKVLVDGFKFDGAIYDRPRGHTRKSTEEGLDARIH
jgi:hypothetical protein